MKQRKKWFIGMIMLGIGAMILLGSQPAQGQEKVFKWKLASAYLTGQPLWKETTVYFVEAVKRMSNNRLQIQAFPGGAVVPPMEIGGAVRKGTVQMGTYWPGWDMGVDPTTCILGGFAGGMNSELTFNWLYAEGGAELWTQFRRDRFEVHALPCGFYGTETFLYSHKPINSLKDVQGMKIRCAGAWADILTKMGASTVTLPSGEVLPALERKVIDATELTTPGGDLPLGFPRGRQIRHIAGGPSTQRHLRAPGEPEGLGGASGGFKGHRGIGGDECDVKFLGETYQPGCSGHREIQTAGKYRSVPSGRGPKEDLRGRLGVGR
jgi:TRAP-type mannitol/chloroaromatic compound transport system substrate-binding protein